MAPRATSKPESKGSPAAVNEEIEQLLNNLRQIAYEQIGREFGRSFDAAEKAVIDVPFNIIALIKDRDHLLSVLRGLAVLVSGQQLEGQMKDAYVAGLANFVEQEPILQAFMNIPAQDFPEIPPESMYMAVRSKWLEQHEREVKQCEEPAKKSSCETRKRRDTRSRSPRNGSHSKSNASRNRRGSDNRKENSTRRRRNGRG